MFRRTVSLLVGGVLVSGSLILAQGRGAAPSIEGAWRVAEIVVTGAGAATNTAPQPGLYLFTKGHYSIVTVNGTAPRKDFGTAADANALTNAEKLARYDAWNALTANSGTYEIKGSVLTTHPVVAKNPAVMGTTGTRDVKFEGAALVLIQKSAQGQPVSETRTKLTRIE